ncbi:MAG: hypothetical protein QOF84_4076 [Streptomyces sp.]|nr:hypothetical protein [Streptomyces sp.]
MNVSRRLLAVLLPAALVAGCGGSAGSGHPGTSGGSSARPSTSAPTGIPGCAPECLSGISDPGTLKAGPYRTAHFLNGLLTLDLKGEWESHEDQPVEFSLAPQGNWDVHRVLFWSDIIPVGKNGKPAAGVPHTTAGMLAWLRTRQNVKVSAPRSDTIGTRSLPAEVVDIEVARDAVNEATDCPVRACADFLTWPNAGENVYGIAEPAVLRLYLSDIGYGGSRHLLAVGVEGQSPADLKDFLPTAEQLIADADAPVSSF